jgi:alpha-beta hydrolase superfamily lysophospholipase
MRPTVRILLILALFPALLSAVAGWMGAPGFLHPEKRRLTSDMVRGWKVRAAKPNGAWVLVFHGVADNRYGTEEHARMLLQSGYCVAMMDSRAHGASGGKMASYGWRNAKTRAR